CGAKRTWLGEWFVGGGGGVVAGDHGLHIAKIAKFIDPPADARAGAAAGAAVRAVRGDDGVTDGQARCDASGRCSDNDAAAEAVAAVGTGPAGAADGLVAGDDTVAEADGTAVRAVINRPSADGETAAPAAAAFGPGAAGAAQGFIGGQHHAGNGGGREDLYRQAAAHASAPRAAAAAGAADGGAVME